jgi:hypothetical protein
MSVCPERDGEFDVGGTIWSGAARVMKVLWPFGVVLRREASSRLMLRRLNAVVVSDEEKAP